MKEAVKKKFTTVAILCFDVRCKSTTELIFILTCKGRFRSSESESVIGSKFSWNSDFPCEITFAYCAAKATNCYSCFAFVAVHSYNTKITFMVYSHCTGTEPGQVHEMGPRAVGTNILYRNVHTGPRQGKEPGSIVSYCVDPLPSTCLVPFPCSVNQP